MGALDTDKILQEEAQAIHGEKAAGVTSKTGPQLYHELRALNSNALCLSGGGIRSAAFALGIIQGLAAYPPPAKNAPRPEENSFLSKFHYLSTVSGGGYIGSWLSAWVTRAGFSEVWANLVGRPKGPDLEPPSIAWLRSYSNYLTPKLGLGSGDTWASVAIILRNLALNWFVILPVLCCALLIAKAYAFLVAWFSQFAPNDCGVPTYFPAVVGAFAIIAGLWFAHTQRPAHNDSTRGPRAVALWYLFPTVIAGLLFALALASQCAYARHSGLPALFWTGWSKAATGVTYGVPIFMLAWLLAFPFWKRWTSFYQAVGELIHPPKDLKNNKSLTARWTDVKAAWPAPTTWQDVRRDLFGVLVAGAVFGVLMAMGVHLYQEYLWPKGFWKFDKAEIFLVVFAVPWTLGSLLLAEMFFVGLTSHEKNSDADREWLGRASGYLMVFALVWTGIMFLTFLAATIVIGVYAKIAAWVAGGGAGTIAARLAKSGVTPAKGPARNGKALSANVMIFVLAVVFGVVLIVTVSAALDLLLFGQDLVRSAGFHREVVLSGIPQWPEGNTIWIGLLAMAALAFAASYFVNINHFSLHALYRNRLIRAFLGASHADVRTANPFTDFDDKDNLRVSQLWPLKEYQADLAAGWQPFHVINIALNAVSTRRLAWQERKAESFTVSPLHAGTACVAYRSSSEYGGPNGISLGTAVAISGAAANSNMGYHSSPAFSFLMTMFNVRLGWWLGNPGSKSYASEGPTLAIMPLLNEMMGNTTDESTYVNLSDGGHFENLGLYEMVRRRCRFIVVSDGGCDPEFAFEDLGNAIRKISLDLGVTITFHGLSTLRTRAQEDREQSHKSAADPQLFAIGNIHYGPQEPAGTILYIKAAYHKGVVRNVGVRSYAIANPDFPHQTTGDQFFSESQFESYRALGYEIISDVFRRGEALLNNPTAAPTLAGIMSALHEEAVKEGRP